MLLAITGESQHEPEDSISVRAFRAG